MDTPDGAVNLSGSFSFSNFNKSCQSKLIAWAEYDVDADPRFALSPTYKLQL